MSNRDVATTAIRSIREMNQARIQLSAAKGRGYMTTREVVETCLIDVSAELLIGYPAHVMPRRRKNPRSQRPTYLWDPRDVVALPIVLGEWERAVAEGFEAEEAFRVTRLAALRNRDRADLGLDTAEAA